MAVRRASQSDMFGSSTRNVGVLPFFATGGTETTSGGYKIHTFSYTGAVTEFIATRGSTTVEFLILGGGGPGGFRNIGGGGGAGGFISSTITVGTASYSVYAGGKGVLNTNENGQNSYFGASVVVGGGAGAYEGNAGVASSKNGGSGGGASYTANFGTGTSGQGFSGGQGIANPPGTNNMGGGGGGAGGVGGNYSGYNAGQGGPGLSNSISGSSVIYAAGGGGGAQTYTGGLGGSTPVGGSGASGGGQGTAATANRGSGGGGASYATDSGRDGSDGIVIVRYII